MYYLFKLAIVVFIRVALLLFLFLRARFKVSVCIKWVLQVYGM